MKGIIRLGLAAMASGLIMGAFALPAQAAESKVASVDLTDRCDSGEGVQCWAKDNMRRQIKITETSPGKYSVIIHDIGTFTTRGGQQTPSGSDGGATFDGEVTGTINGDWSGTLTAPANFATYDKSALDDSIDGDLIKTPAIVGQLFTSGDSPTVLSDAWGWTYKYKGQRWVNASSGNSGNITG